MAHSWISRLFQKAFRPPSQSGRKQTFKPGFAPVLEPLNDRVMPAVTAFFVPQVGALTILGDAGNNSIAVRRDAAGKILVNGGAITVFGGNATVANTNTISVFGLAGNDTVTLDEMNGALPKAMLFGEAGNDNLTGGLGDDQVYGEAGDDRMIWNPGDASDTVEGQDGFDTMRFNGANVNEQFDVSANGSRVRVSRNVGAVTMDLNAVESVDLNALGGADTLSGGAGDDVLVGGAGQDILDGGTGDNILIQ